MLCPLMESDIVWYWRFYSFIPRCFILKVTTIITCCERLCLCCLCCSSNLMSNCSFGFYLLSSLSVHLFPFKRHNFRKDFIYLLFYVDHLFVSPPVL